MTENRIDRTLQALKQQGKKALIPFVTAGHGGYDRTEQLVLQMEKAGADIIELGVPFSDPIAEGPVIQHASEQALKQGTTLAGIFELVKRLRKKTDMPLLLMMYLNTIFSHGTEEFFRTCQEIGIDGVIVPDMPFEEKDEIQGSADKYHIHNIYLHPIQSFRLSGKVLWLDTSRHMHHIEHTARLSPDCDSKNT